MKLFCILLCYFAETVMSQTNRQNKILLIVSFDDAEQETKRLKANRDLLTTVADVRTVLHSFGDTIGNGSFRYELIDALTGKFSTVSDDLLLSLASTTNHLFVHVINLDQHVDRPPPLCIEGRAFDTSQGLKIASLVGNMTHTIHIREREQADLGTGLITWDGAIVLAKYLEVHQEKLVHGRTVLEVGAGTGVVGCTAALLGASETLLTDLHYTLDNLQSNVDASLAGAASAMATARVACLDWADSSTYQFPSSNPPLTAHTFSGAGTAEGGGCTAESTTRTSGDDCGASSSSVGTSTSHINHTSCHTSCHLHPPAQNADTPTHWDLVVGADVVWLEDLVPLLVRALGALCGPHTTLILAHQKRSERTDKLLFDQLIAHFSIELIPPDEYHPQFQVPKIRLFRGVKKQDKGSSEAV